MAFRTRVLLMVLALFLALQGPLPAAAAASGSCSTGSTDQVCNTSTCGDNFATSCGNSLGQSIGTAGVILVAAVAVVAVGACAYYLLRPHQGVAAAPRSKDKGVAVVPDSADLLPSRASAGLTAEPSI